MSSPLHQIKRTTQISKILAKHGFAHLTSSSKEPSLDAPGAQSDEEHTRPVRLRKMLEDLGPTFIKFGQIISTRPDVLGKDYIDELGKLQDDVQEVPYEEILEEIKIALDGDPYTVFSSIEAEPLATASIAQVHRATLISGQEVVLKVRKPGITEIVDADLDLMRTVLKLILRAQPELSMHEPEELFEYFKSLLENELDFLVEVAQLERFELQHKDDTIVKIPQVYRDYCRANLLVMDLVDGVSIKQWMEDRTPAFEPKELGTINAKLILDQIFTHGYFHGDPHPGNVYLTQDGKICYLDFGLMGQLDEKSRLGLARLLQSIIKKDETRIVDALLGLTDWDEEPNRRDLEIDVADYLTRHFYQPLKHLRLGEVLQDLLDRITAHKLRLPESVYMMIKSLSTMEGWVKELNADIDIIDLCRPMVYRALLERFNPNRMTEETVALGTDLIDMLQKLPDNVEQSFNRIKQGELNINVKPKGLGHIDKLIDQIVTRITSALIVAGLIVGSSLIVQSKIPPLFHDVSIIGMTGYLIAAFEGCRLIFTRIKYK